MKKKEKIDQLKKLLSGVCFAGNPSHITEFYNHNKDGSFTNTETGVTFSETEFKNRQHPVAATVHTVIFEDHS